MNIGNNIKKLRREREITQEQLAEYLNISVSAISQWECNKTAPDISLLAPLANIFEVSADVILGIDIDTKEKKIDEIYMSAYNDSVAGYRERAAETLKKGLAEYPDSYKLMLACAPSGNDEASLREAASIYQKVIDGCSDNKLRLDAIQSACMTYPKIGRREEAVALAKSLPVYNMSSNEMLTQIYEGDELFEQFQTNIIASQCVLVYNMLDIIQHKLDDGTAYYTDDELLIICEKVVKIMETVFEDGNYFYYSQYIRIAHVLMSKIYANRMDADNALTQLEHAATYAIMFDKYEYDELYSYTSILFRGMEGGGYYKDSPDSSHSSDLLETLSNSRYDFIRANPRFIAVETELRNAYNNILRNE